MGELAVRPVERDQVAALVRVWLETRQSAHTRAAYRRDVDAWLSWCARHHVDPMAARVEHALLWLRELDNAGEAARTRRRRASALSSLYRFAVRAEVATRNPFDLDRQDRPRPPRGHDAPVPSLDQVAAMLRTAVAEQDNRPRTAALLGLLAYTGARVGEILAADVEDVTMQAGQTVLALRGKGGAGEVTRVVPIPPPLFAMLDAYLQTRHDVDRLPALAAGARARRPLVATRTGRRLDRQTVRDIVQRVAVAAGIPEQVARRLSPHALRHAYATISLDRGVPLDAVQDAMGHASPVTTRAYDHHELAPERHPTTLIAAALHVTGRPGSPRADSDAH